MPPLTALALEREAARDVVGGALDLDRLALALGGPGAELAELAGVAARLAAADGGEQRAVADEVGVAADRRGEVAVARRAQAGVADVARRVVGLLERAQHERAEAPARRGRRSARSVDAPGDRADELARLRRRELLGQRRCRHAERGELRDEALDALGLGALVDAVEARHAALLEQARRPARWRRSSGARSAGGTRSARGTRIARDAAVRVEGELRFAALDPRRAARARARRRARRRPARGRERRPPTARAACSRPAKMRSTRS